MDPRSFLLIPCKLSSRCIVENRDKVIDSFNNDQAFSKEAQEIRQVSKFSKVKLVNEALKLRQIDLRAMIH